LRTSTSKEDRSRSKSGRREEKKVVGNLISVASAEKIKSIYIDKTITKRIVPANEVKKLKSEASKPPAISLNVTRKSHKGTEITQEIKVKCT